MLVFLLTSTTIRGRDGRIIGRFSPPHRQKKRRVRVTRPSWSWRFLFSFPYYFVVSFLYLTASYRSVTYRSVENTWCSPLSFPASAGHELLSTRYIFQEMNRQCWQVFFSTAYSVFIWSGMELCTNFCIIVATDIWNRPYLGSSERLGDAIGPISRKHSALEVDVVISCVCVYINTE